MLPKFSSIIYTNTKNPVEPLNILIKSLILIIQENNRVITTKKGKGKLPIFCSNGYQVIHIYGGWWVDEFYVAD